VKRRLPHLVIAGGSLTFLVSLYFTWIDATLCFTRSYCVVSHTPEVATDGWSGFGQVAAVLALALAAGAIAAIANEELATRLPFGEAAVALGIFALLSVSDLWTNAVAFSAPLGQPTIGLGAAAYVGLAGVVVACVGAAAGRWRGITLPRRGTTVSGTLMTLALLASFVLPALSASSYADYELGFGNSSSTFICAFACLGLLAWRGRRPGPRLATAAAVGTLVAASLLPSRHQYARWPYEFWLLLACAAGLLLLGLVGSSGLRIRRPSVPELAIVVGSVVLLVSLFLPWQSGCGDGICFSRQSGWSNPELAGVFALGLLLALVWVGRFARELALGAVIVVLSAGLTTATPHDFVDFGKGGAHAFINLDYGALLGFAGAAILVVLSLGGSRPIPDKRSLVRLVPLLATLGLLAFAVAPNVLVVTDLLEKDDLFALQSPFLPLGLLGAMTILVTLRLVLRWLDGPGDQAEVVVLPLALLALVGLAAIHDAVVTTTSDVLGPIYGKGISWEGWVSLFLCLLLAACGWIARRGGDPVAGTDGSPSTTSLATSS
jgi:hypothetical protein